MLRSEPCTERTLRSAAFVALAEEIRPAWDGAGTAGPILLHRKLWEWLYITISLRERGMLEPGRRGLGFGVGQEPLAALFASQGCEIVATDLALEDASAAGWVDTNQHAQQLQDLNVAGLCPADEFEQRVEFRIVDMNSIPDDLQGFDFTWSSCAFEHLGSIARGQLFIARQMKCLRPGGVAVHTTELNVGASSQTIDFAHTVLFRRRDLEDLAVLLHAAGDTIDLSFDTGDSAADRHVDVVPFTNVHLKVNYEGFTTTSMGLTIQKGDSPRRKRHAPQRVRAELKVYSSAAGRRLARGRRQCIHEARRIVHGIRRRILRNRNG